MELEKGIEKKRINAKRCQKVGANERNDRADEEGHDKNYRKPINARVLHERDKRRHAQSARIAKGTAERHNKLPSEHQHLVGVIGDPD